MELTASRTNRVIVPDLDSLLADLKRYGLSAEKVHSTTKGDLLYHIHEIDEQGAHVTFMVDGYVPGLDLESVAYRIDPDGDLDDDQIPQEYIDLPELIARHIADGQVLIMLGARINKLAYMNGYAVATDNAGRRQSIDLLDHAIEMAETLQPRDGSLFPPVA